MKRSLLDRFKYWLCKDFIDQESFLKVITTFSHTLYIRNIARDYTVASNQRVVTYEDFSTVIFHACPTLNKFSIIEAVCQDIIVVIYNTNINLIKLHNHIINYTPLTTRITFI